MQALLMRTTSSDDSLLITIYNRTFLNLNAPSLTDQSQQGFWRGAQAGDKPMAGKFKLALAGRGAGDDVTPFISPVLMRVVCWSGFSGQVSSLTSEAGYRP